MLSQEPAPSLQAPPANSGLPRALVTGVLAHGLPPPPVTGPIDNLDRGFNFQEDVQRSIIRLWAEKQRKMPPPSLAVSNNTNSTVQGRVPPININTTTNTPHPRPDNMPNFVLGSDSEDLDRDFTMFDDTPRDRNMVTEKEWSFYPYDQPEPDRTLSLSRLPSLEEWVPELDTNFQLEAQWHLDNESDYRFKAPKTSNDVASLQQALEITRMDFWIRNPRQTYPPDLSQHKRESYGSQHRRLQHAFSRICREVGNEPAPELYRLPAWMFGFAPYYWTPSTWGVDKRSRVYNQGLVEMAAEKNEKGVHGVDYLRWKATLEGLVRVVEEEARTELGLFVGSGA